MGLSEQLADLAQSLNALKGLHRGIEKESLRVTPDGNLSMRPHPPSLGSALAHPAITTDFSEAQLELITAVHDSPDACLNELQRVHDFVYANLNDELLWPTSMPCMVDEDSDIPVGQYGTSNIGMAKTVYRLGLGVRYGRLMQTISGIHYNFSVTESLWQALGVTDQQGRTEAYLSLIRNFRRWSWLLIYAFGASPAVCKSFTRRTDHQLSDLDDGTHYLPYATSLRMGPLGYQSEAQTQLHISYNSIKAYTDSMVNALTTPYPAYADIGLKDPSGAYQQLSTSIIQIENEFYGTIRPKRTILKGERPVTALLTRGVEYVEVRCMDLNPFLPLGIDKETICFIDTFLMMCLLADSGPDDVAESMRLTANQLAVVERGRDPDLTLLRNADESTKLADWAHELLGMCAAVAEQLDRSNDTDSYSQSVKKQSAKVDDPGLTPSAQILTRLSEEEIPFYRFAMNQAQSIRTEFAEHPLSGAALEKMRAHAAASLTAQAQAEAADTVDFEQFLIGYLALPEQ